MDESAGTDIRLDRLQLQDVQYALVLNTAAPEAPSTFLRL